MSLFPSVNYCKLSIQCLFLLSLILLTFTAFVQSDSTPLQARPVPIAIDFGSEFSKISSIKAGAGGYHIVVDEQSKRKIPNVIAFEGGERHFGNGGSQLTMRKPKETYWWAHRLLGQPFNSTAMRDLQAQGYPYEFIPLDHRKSIGIRHRHSNGEISIYSIEEIVAMSLEYLTHVAEADAQTSVHGAVLSVPPYWTQSERQAMLDAASLANLNVYNLMNENTAAGVQYGIDRKYDESTPPHTIMLYNMGSTSTKVSIITYAPKLVKEGRKNRTEGEMEVRSLAFDRSLGGADFEARLTIHLANFITAELQKLGEPTNVWAQPKAVAKIRSAAEKAKIILSANSETVVNLPGLVNDRDFRLMITRDEFQTMCADLITRSSASVTEALAAAGLQSSDLDNVLIIGGGVRIPAIQTRLREVLGRETLGQSLNGDEAMVMGAEFKSIEWSRQFKTRPFSVIDISPYAVDAHIYDLNTAADAVATNADASEDSDDATSNFSKHIPLFKTNNRLNKKRTIGFTHDSDLICSLEYNVSAHNLLPPLFQPTIITYNVTGINALRSKPKYQPLLETQKPRISLVFLLDPSGIVSLVSGEATLEELREVKVLKKKNVTELINATSDAASEKEASTESTNTNTGEEPAQAANDATGDPETDTATKSTENEDSTSTSTSTPASDSNSTVIEEDEYEYTTKKVTHRIPLRINVIFPSKTSTYADVTEEEEKSEITALLSHADILAKPTIYSMSFDEKQVAKGQLLALSHTDQLKKEIAKNRNDLEAFIYSHRRLTEEDSWAAVTIQSQIDEVIQALAEAEDWLYGDFEEETPALFLNKLQSLKNLTDPIILRVSERTDLPAAVNTSRSVLNFTLHQSLEYATSRPWVPAESLEKLADLTRDAYTWLEEQVKLQANVARHEVPVLTSRMIYEKMIPLTNLSTEILKLKKPAPPKKKKAAKRDKSETDEASGSEKNETEKDTSEETAAEDASTGDQNTADSTNGEADAQSPADSNIPEPEAVTNEQEPEPEPEPSSTASSRSESLKEEL